jgi:Tol biopolymer transport system component
MRKLIVSAVAMLGVAAVSGSAQAVVAGANGRIVFTRADCTVREISISICSSWWIVTANPNDTNETVVAGPYPQSAFDEHFNANWSPDGTKLTFMVNQGIWTLNADGTGLTDVFQPPVGTGVDDSPTFTPDGKHIIFTRCCIPGYGYSLWMINSDGGGLKDVTKEPVVNGDGPADTTPQVSPDGKTIVFNRCFPDAPCEVATVSINGTNLHDLTDNTQFLSEHPNWSPDGKKIVFEMDPLGRASPNIATINPDGSGFTQLTFSQGPQSRSLEPAYSPDGTKIIFSEFRSTGGYDLFTMNADGSRISQITSTVSQDFYPEWGVAQ